MLEKRRNFFEICLIFVLVVVYHGCVLSLFSSSSNVNSSVGVDAARS